VPGSYSTPNKRVQGVVLGAVGGGILGATAQAATAGAVVGCVAGGAIAQAYSRDSLISALRKQGVVVIAVGDKLRLVLPSDQLFELGTPSLLPESHPMLDNVAALLKE